MSYRRCADCGRYARLSDEAICQDCDDFTVAYKVKNIQNGDILHSDTYQMFRKDYKSRWYIIRRYVSFESPQWVSVIKSEKSESGIVVLQIDQSDYKSYRRRSTGFQEATEEITEKVEYLLTGRETY